MIPVLGVPVLDRYDLLTTMEQSVDHEVDRYYVVDNGGKYESTQPPLSTLADSIHVANVGVNLGYAASVNLIIRANFRAPWWLVTNDDIAFGEGALKQLDERMWDSMDRATVGLAFGFSCLAFNDKAIEEVGWFDEHYYPAYVEDCDWMWRARKLDVRFFSIESATTHGGSQTIADPARRKMNDITYPRNKDFHRTKWGGEPWAEVYDTPFDAGGPLDVTTAPKLSRLRELAW